MLVKMNWAYQDAGLSIGRLHMQWPLSRLGVPLESQREGRCPIEIWCRGRWDGASICHV